MKIEFKTAIPHDKGECCGCWHFIIDEDAPSRPYARCNECGEMREAVFPGISFTNRQE